jgi:bis(5'-nucleosyl)-tetraphosphatase (symmetrical)
MAAGRLFAIGDLQGCHDEFQRLLAAIAFDPACDRLWLAGDLVNRGPKSLETLRLCYQLKDVSTIVLGNHDLHLLAVAFGGHKPKKKDTLQNLLDAPDAAELCGWLRQLPLLHFDEQRNAMLVHAGILPAWSIQEALTYAAEVTATLQGKGFTEFLKVIYGNKPDHWDPKLKGHSRLRVITNVFTRMRFVSRTGALDMNNKGPASKPSAGFVPWFDCPRADSCQIFFGHWAALEGNTGKPQFRALDTGCVWGGVLRAIEVDTGMVTEVRATPGTPKNSAD